MNDNLIKANSLVLYKSRPARVVSVGDKIELALEGGGAQRVRPKDVMLLHPGPLTSLGELVPQESEAALAWELLEDGSVTLQDLSELLFDAYSPLTAWAAWQLVDEGLYFQGSPEAIRARSAEELRQTREAREAKAAQRQAWEAFVGRVQEARLLPDDNDRLADVVALAEGRGSQSRLLKTLAIPATPENAHALLLRTGWWEESVNPYPRRCGQTMERTPLAIGELPEEERLDLRHLDAFAIDDEGNQDPDDAVSLDGDRIWVHVADVAALSPPDSPLDLAARDAGATLYLPERTLTMLPVRATELLGLGLQEPSPSLSFGFSLDADAAVSDVVVRPSLVRVTRLSYAQAEKRLHEEPFARLLRLTEEFRARRLARGAAVIELPEVKIRLRDGEVSIQELPPLRSRRLVTEAMLMAGAAAAQFAITHKIPFPFTAQAPPETQQQPTDLASAFAYRKSFQRSQNLSSPAPHAGLGLAMYARATSPLRRYLDLVVHQQLRAFLRGAAPLDAEAVLARVGAAEAVIDGIRRAERLSNRHWTCVYLQRKPDWQGSAILVEQRGRRGLFVIPALGLEASILLEQELPLNSTVSLALSSVNLPELQAHFVIRHRED